MSNITAALLKQFNDDDPVVRQDAAIALGDMGHLAVDAVDILRARLLSACLTYHDRACAAWAVSQIVPHGNSAVVADLVHVLQTELASPDAHRLRYHCGFAIEHLSSDDDVLELVRRSRNDDPYWLEVARIVAEIPATLDLA